MWFFVYQGIFLKVRRVEVLVCYLVFYLIFCSFLDKSHIKMSKRRVNNTKEKLFSQFYILIWLFYDVGMFMRSLEN